MFISRVALDPARLSASRLGPIAGGGYGEHQALWRLFGDDPDRRRDFLYRREADHWPTYIVVSRRQPADSEGLWRLETKPYQPRLSQGVTLSFVLRANPVRRRRREDGRTQRHDVVMDAKHRRRDQAGGEVEPAGIDMIQEAGIEWLAERAASLGFSPEAGCVLAEGYAQHLLRKPSGRQIRFSSLDFRGVLRVTDPERFVATLFQGIGPSKAFGCGLMLVRPA